MKEPTPRTASIDLPKVNRVEVIDPTGRAYCWWDKDCSVELQVQDDGKTLKVFVTPKEK